MTDREVIVRALCEESLTAWREGITRGAERVADAVLAALKASERVIVPAGALDQNAAMRAELAYIGNLVSSLAAAMRVDQANDNGAWPDIAGRIEGLIAAAKEPTDGR